MIKKLLGAIGIVALTCSTALGSVAVDSTNFPDATFRSYVITNFDANSDGTLSDSELARATTIDIQGSGTMNLKGIEKLTGVKRLYCNYAITSGGNPNFDYTSFKAAYGLNCDVDDSYFLVLYIQDQGRGGMMTPYVRDVLDTSSGSYVLKPFLGNGRTLDSLEFRTRGTPAIEVHVEP